jgi:hypothetical protein
MIVMLGISPVALAEILTIGDSDQEGNASASWTESGAYGHADIICSYGYGQSSGWNVTYTTTAGYFNWCYYLYAYSEAQLFLWSNVTCSAEAYASCQASCPHDSHSMFTHAFVQDAGEYGRQVGDWEIGSINGIPKYDGFYWMGSGHRFEVWQGVSAGHGAFAQAEISTGENDQANSHGCVACWGGLW